MDNAGFAIWKEFNPEDFITTISRSLSSFENVINNPKKTPNEILIDNHAGMLKIDNLKKSKRLPPFSNMNFMYLND